ncbi:MAG: hypothetical protein KAY46_11225 [Burkholderiaceae bacterium]|nr:hypothetical protein [Burkholderiaceae bacterium]
MRNSYRIPAMALGLSVALAACGGSGGDDGPPAPPVLVDAESVRAEAGISGDTFLEATKAVAALTDEVSEPRRIDVATPPDDETSEPAPLG